MGCRGHIIKAFNEVPVNMCGAEAILIRRLKKVPVDMCATEAILIRRLLKFQLICVPQRPY